MRGSVKSKMFIMAAVIAATLVGPSTSVVWAKSSRYTHEAPKSLDEPFMRLDQKQLKSALSDGKGEIKMKVHQKGLFNDIKVKQPLAAWGFYVDKAGVVRKKVYKDESPADREVFGIKIGLNGEVAEVEYAKYVRPSSDAAPAAPATGPDANAGPSGGNPNATPSNSANSQGGAQQLQIAFDFVAPAGTNSTRKYRRWLEDGGFSKDRDGYAIFNRQRVLDENGNAIKFDDLIKKLQSGGRFALYINPNGSLQIRSYQPGASNSNNGNSGNGGSSSGSDGLRRWGDIVGSAPSSGASGSQTTVQLPDLNVILTQLRTNPALQGKTNEELNPLAQAILAYLQDPNAATLKALEDAMKALGVQGQGLQFLQGLFPQVVNNGSIYFGGFQGAPGNGGPNGAWWFYNGGNQGPSQGFYGPGSQISVQLPDLNSILTQLRTNPALAGKTNEELNPLAQAILAYLQDPNAATLKALEDAMKALGVQGQGLQFLQGLFPQVVNNGSIYFRGFAGGAQPGAPGASVTIGSMLVPEEFVTHDKDGNAVHHLVVTVDGRAETLIVKDGKARDSKGNEYVKKDGKWGIMINGNWVDLGAIALNPSSATQTRSVTVDVTNPLIQQIIANGTQATGLVLRNGPNGTERVLVFNPPLDPQTIVPTEYLDEAAHIEKLPEAKTFFTEENK